MLTVEVVGTGRTTGEVRPQRCKMGWKRVPGDHQGGRGGKSLRRRLSQRHSTFRLGGSLAILPSIGGGWAADLGNVGSSVETRQIDGFDQPPAPPGTHVVGMQLIDPNTCGWKYFNATMGTPVEIISNATGPAGADRVNAWIDALVTTVERNGGRLSTRTGAGAAPAANQTQPTATGNQPSGVTRTVN